MNIPVCSISKEIEEVVSLCEKLIDKRLSRLFQPAHEKDILAWEQTNGIIIPETYKEWLRFSNGAQIYGQLACIFGVNKITVEDDFIPDHLVYIGDLVGDFEYLCFERETGRVVSFLDVYREEHLTVYGDFKDFLLETIRFMQGALGDDECESDCQEKKMSYESIVRDIEFLKKMKNSPGGLTEELVAILEELESTLRERS